MVLGLPVVPMFPQVPCISLDSPWFCGFPLFLVIPFVASGPTCSLGLLRFLVVCLCPSLTLSVHVHRGLCYVVVFVCISVCRVTMC